MRNLSWQFCSRAPSLASAWPMPPTDAALAAIRHRKAHASSMAGAAVPPYGTSALPELDRVPHAGKAMRGALVTRLVSRVEGRDRLPIRPNAARCKPCR
jgi:hypothetical protein